VPREGSSGWTRFDAGERLSAHGSAVVLCADTRTGASLLQVATTREASREVRRAASERAYALAMQRFSVATSTLVAVVVLSGCGSQEITCVAVPTSFPNNRILTTQHTHLTVPVNAIVWIALVEAENYAAHRGFRWATPTTSDRSVLAPVHLCKRTSVSTLPEEISAFKALRPGTATLTARLAPGWPGSIKPRLQPALNNVTVR
jgi:hypothetical protein